MEQRGIHNDIETRTSQIGHACRRTGPAGCNLSDHLRRFAGPRGPLRRYRRSASKARSMASRSAPSPRRQRHLPVAPAGQGSLRSAVAAATPPTNCSPRPTAAGRSRRFSNLSPPRRPSSSPSRNPTCSRAQHRCIKRIGLLHGDDRLDALPSPRYELHPHQNRGVDSDLARHGPVKDAERPGAGEKSSAYPPGDRDVLYE